MAATVNVNGRVFDQEHAVVSVFDHGFLYGEGVFETMRTFNGKPFLFERHMQRLPQFLGYARAAGAAVGRRTDGPVPQHHAGGRAWGSSGERGVLRVLLTRGVGELSYDPAACPVPTVIVIVKPQIDPPPEVYERGVTIALVPIVRNHPGSVNPLIKSNNLLNNALAAQEAARRGAFEGVMRNFKGELAECTTANLFVVKGGVALTPPLDAGLLPGITRGFLFEVGAEPGIPVREAVLRDGDLFNADEVFFTSTTRGVVPATKVDARVIGNGMPGPVTNALLSAYLTRARESDQR